MSAALTASLESFIHKTLKDEQVECIHRIACKGRDVSVVLPMGFGKSAMYQLIPYNQHLYQVFQRVNTSGLRPNLLRFLALTRQSSIKKAFSVLDFRFLFFCLNCPFAFLEPEVNPLGEFTLWRHLALLLLPSLLVSLIPSSLEQTLN